ncbi:MAG TPA: rhamnulokinase family protein [Tepidisphaeraceae bacterium]|jgi:rhamnulokinase|nr:rhamnulokinase family protein [Tepidisphaeraceae bacterium]
MSDQHFVAFDLGAESGRSVVGKLSNGKLSLEETHRFLNPTGRINGHLHWNLLSQWEELKIGLRKSAKGRKIDGIGVDTWGVDFGFVGVSGEILGFPYNYRDERTNGVMDETFKRVSKQEIFEATGIQFMQLNSLYQLIATQRDTPGLLSAAKTLLFIPDLFNYLFTGVRKSEFSIATTSQFFDPRKNSWAIEMLKKLKLPTEILPEVVPTGTVLGPLREDVAKECGVPQIPVIAPGCHDTASAVVAVPASGEDWCYISSGTWSLMGVELDKPLINDKALKYNYTNEGGIGGTIRFLKNIMGLWLVQECRRQLEKEGQTFDYTQLTKMASDAKPFSSIINPDHAPFLSPGEMPKKIGEFCQKTNQTPPASTGELIRSCLESLALTYRRTLEGMQDVLGRKMKVIHVVGGGSRNELLNQMTADACGIPVIAGPVEATAAGNILVQAMALGSIKSLAEAREAVQRSFDVKRYEPKNTKQWDSAYERYLGLL